MDVGTRFCFVTNKGRHALLEVRGISPSEITVYATVWEQ